MEILIISVLSLLLIAGVFLYNHTVSRQHTTEAMVRKDLEATKVVLEECKAQHLLLKKDIDEIAFENNAMVDQYNEMLMLVLPRLFHMELTAFVHQQGVVRQAIVFNDEKLKLAVATMLRIVLRRFEDIKNPTQYAKEMVEREYYMSYFKEQVLNGRVSGLLRITGKSDYDALNIILDAILSHGENDIIGIPKYHLATKQPVELS